MFARRARRNPAHRSAARMVPALLALAIVLAGAGCSRETRDVPGRRIVLITLDTLRYDRFAGGGEIGIPMPATRALAERGRVFDRAYAATSTTQPTHASIFTGLHPWQHGVTRNGLALAEDLETVVERMHARRFETAAVVASFPVHRGFGFAQGFERFDDEFTAGQRRRWSQVEVPGGRWYSQADWVTQRALAQIDTSRGARQFFWFHYFDAHGPYGDAPGVADPIVLGELKQEIRADPRAAAPRVAQALRYYDHDVRFLDEQLGRLFERLLADAETIETHLLIVADHGESFGEGGSVGHGERLTTEQIHVPLVIVSPLVTPGVVELPVGSTDIATTLDRLAGGEGLGGGALDLTSDPASWPAQRLVAGMRKTFAEPFDDVRTDGRVERLQGPLFYWIEAGREIVGSASAVAANDGAPVPPALARRAGALFEVFASELGSAGPPDALDPETREALEALGYAQ